MLGPHDGGAVSCHLTAERPSRGQSARAGGGRGAAAAAAGGGGGGLRGRAVYSGKGDPGSLKNLALTRSANAPCSALAVHQYHSTIAIVGSGESALGMGE